MSMQHVPAEPTKHTLTEHITKILCDSHDGMHLNFNGGRLRWGVASGIAELIAAAAEEHYRPRVEQVDAPDSMPVGTILADLYCDLTPPPVYVRFIDGWSLDGLKVKPGRRNLTVLWSPGAGE